MRELLLKIGSLMENGDIIPGGMSPSAFLKLKYEIQIKLLEVNNYGSKRDKSKEPDEYWGSDWEEHA